MHSNRKMSRGCVDECSLGLVRIIMIWGGVAPPIILKDHAMKGNDIGENLSQNLKIHRKMQGLTQRTLAKVSGVGLCTIRDIEQQNTHPKVATLMRLAGVLYCSVEDLINREKSDDF